MIEAPWLEPLLLLLVAPVIGSFLGVVILRLPEARAIVWDRSRCDACGAPLAWHQLIPLFSWAAASGRCTGCGRPVSPFYPAVELAALAIAASALFADGIAAAWLDCLLGWWLLTLAWIDARSWLLPDSLTLPLLVAGLVEAAVLEPADLVSRCLGAAAGYGLLRILALLYRARRGFDGLGGGDAKLLGALGAWVGVFGLSYVILGAAVSALCAAGLLRLRGTRLHRHSALPFGPFLAAAGWLVWMLR